MIRVQYQNINLFKRDYWNSYSSIMQTNLRDGWNSLRRKYVFLSPIRCTIEQLLLGNLKMLIRVYFTYIQLYEEWKNTAEQSAIDEYQKDVVSLFNYKYRHSIIAEVFRTSKNGPVEHTCYYCDMAYINTYYHGGTQQSHFDLDHYLDKAKCPLVALSIMNLIPTCPVCNERIKHSELFDDSDRDCCYKLAPNNRAYDFDGNVQIGVVMKKLPSHGGYIANADCFDVDFALVGDSDYGKIIQVLRLKERYSYHKIEALRILENKYRYSDSEIRKIAKLLKRSEDEIHEDIFGEKFMTSQHRVLSKMRRDIMKGSKSHEYLF